MEQLFANKRKGHWWICIWILVSLLVSLSCATQETQKPMTFEELDLSQMTIAVEAGDIYEEVAHRVFNAQNVVAFKTTEEMLKALHNEEIDAILISEGFTAQLETEGIYDDFNYIHIPADVYVNKAAPIFHTQVLRDQYNEWFATAKADGTYQEVLDRWLSGHLPAEEDIPQFDFSGFNKVLRVVDTGNYPPLSYLVADGRDVGFGTDMTNRFALSIGMRPEYTLLPYDEAAQYVLDGKADMSACTYAITGTRAETMIFGEPSVITQIVVIVKK